MNRIKTIGILSLVVGIILTSTSYALALSEGEQLLQRVMREGRIIEPDPPLDRIAKYARERLSRLPEEHKRFEFPHRYRVGISKRLHHLREQQMRKVRY